LTNILDFYCDPKKHDDLKAILDLGAQKHPAGLAQNFSGKGYIGSLIACRK